tara:strand:+ start:149 stop:529 length:381 start_codon:yes stop_codon:yes gene_type:complete
MKTKNIVILSVLGITLAYFLYRKSSKKAIPLPPPNDNSVISEEEKEELFRKANKYYQPNLQLMSINRAKTPQEIRQIQVAYRTMRESSRSKIFKLGLQKEFEKYVLDNPKQRQGALILLGEGIQGE